MPLDDEATAKARPGNRRNLGFAFVDFTTAKAAKKAMKLHDTLFRGRPVTVERCRKEDVSGTLSRCGPRRRKKGKK